MNHVSKKLSLAIEDIYLGARNSEFWIVFGRNDVKAKYRGSRLGRLWLTLSVAIFILVIGGLYRGIFSDNAGNYTAYLAVGYITWLFLSSLVNRGINELHRAKPFVEQKDWPISTFIFRHVLRETLVSLHQYVLLIPIFIWMQHWPGIVGILLAVLGFGLCISTGFFVAMFLSICVLRFGDLAPITQAMMRMVFFATPVIWIEKSLGTFGAIILAINPFKYYIQVVRDPLLYGRVDLHTWLVCIFLLFVAAITSITTLAITKDRISYWL